MAPTAPQLPTKFPCWCRAVYSWGGETKKDLGFVEGDLIECLNAGDGQWWTGRLRRDRRMVGLFPSNFVEVLGEEFVPVNRTTSPMVKPASSPITNPISGPKKQKTVFRKPFQAHKEAMAPGLARSSTAVSSSIPRTPPRDGTIPRSVKPLRTNTAPSTAKPQTFNSRPRPSRLSRARSPSPSRAVSPIPPEHTAPPPTVVPAQSISFPRPASRNNLPLELEQREPVEREESPPPPPPPPHRVAVNRQPSPMQMRRAPSPLNMNDRYVTMSRTPSPAPPSEMNGHTPSPLRDAMEGVMSSLEDMELSGRTSPPSPQSDLSNPWSPDDYNSIHERAASRSGARSLTSLGFERSKDHYGDEGQIHRNNSLYTHDNYLLDGPPQLNNYVQRMESRLRQMQEQSRRSSHEIHYPEEDDEEPPPPPPRNVPYRGGYNSIPVRFSAPRHQRSGYEIQEDILNRSATNKSTATSSTGVQSNYTSMTTGTDETSQSMMSGPSAGGFSATSAASYARRGSSVRPNTAVVTSRSRGFSDVSRMSRPETPLTGISYHSSHNTSRQGASSAIPWSSTGDISPEESAGVFGGLSTPKAKKHGFFKKIFESAKTGAASARNSFVTGQGSLSPTKGRIADTFVPENSGRDAARDIGLGGGSIDWVQVRRDVNRAISPSRHERVERAERCQMMDYPVIYAVEELHETAEGDESIDGLPISEPTDFCAANLPLVDKSARFVTNLPPMINPVTLSQAYVCRPYKTDVQRLRAIFTWVSEKIAWDEPIDEMDVDIKRVLHTKRGSPQEVAILVQEMCAAVGLHAETIQGYLKTPGELFEFDSLSRPNHWWNAVLVDGEWRIMDCSLANPTNPRRNQFVTINSQAAESWYFLARPLEICYTHVPLYPEEQHICPPISPDVLLALPTVCPPFFKNAMQFPDYDTSLIRIEGLEVMQIRLILPPDVECAAEVETPLFATDADGDFFESGDVVRKRALVQPDWLNGQKRFTVKAVLPGDEGQGVLKIYAGKRGLMHSCRDIPHPLALALPIIQTGENPPYDFVLRHPTPHAQRHDLYIMQPQCSRLAVNNTFVFAVRQHPSTPISPSGNESNGNGRLSPSVFMRPASSLSMVSSSAGGSVVSNEFSASTSAISSRLGSGREKPAKLAIQSPSGKIMRLTRKADHMISSTSTADSATDVTADGSIWETVIKIGERGVWRGLVLADRVARWCVFCEWECF
ncbi:cytokinesis protein 3 [Monascus purpureus]|uniref:Cytokinesis protein 3 n=1 Tax=Monascus purpureus TaxID=5098 RepID=A0A507QV65_MONPU|nr:cytokinesis protein 3 [Monascus purpureus]